MSARKLGLLVINGPLPPPYGGVATYLAHALPQLVARGFEVHTIIDMRPRDSRQYAQFERAGVTIHYACGGGPRLKKAWYIFRRLPTWLFRLPIWISTMKSRGINLLAFMKAVKSMANWTDVSEEVLRSEAIDIIHAYDNPWAQGFVATYLAKKYRKRYVQTIFGEVVPHKAEMVHHDRYGERFKELSRYVLQEADLILSVSQHCAREVAYLGLDPGLVRVIRYGINVEEFSPAADAAAIRSQYGLEGKRVVLFAGQIRLRKGPQVLLEAAPEILRRIPQTIFLVVGPDHGIAADLQKRSVELGVDSQFLLVGPVPDENLPAFFGACDVFVFPSCTTIECLGLSIVQAMSCGKPVVASNIGGVPEVVVDGVTGFLVKPNDPRQLAQKIILLLENEELRVKMGKAAREHAIQYFDRNHLVQELLDAYQELIHSPHAINNIS
ncbi:MAG: glycosyltransferase family 4 protein [Bacteroidota bacterium]